MYITSRSYNCDKVHTLTEVSDGNQCNKVLGVMWTFDFPEDLSFNLPLTKHLLAVISKKYVWDCQIFDIWMIKASIVEVMWCYCSHTSVKAVLSEI